MMTIDRALITMAGPDQRALPQQRLIDRDGAEKTLLHILIEETLAAGVDEIGVVIQPGQAAATAEAAGALAGRLTFIEQVNPRGYGHAIYCARDFIGRNPFLHLVGDHVYVSNAAQRSAQQLVAIAQAQGCSVSAVQATRERLLPQYGAVGGDRLAGQSDLYRVQTVLEKPSPTAADQHLFVSGLRAGHYLCFFGIHVLTPTVFDVLGELLAADDAAVTLSAALAELAQRETYLAWQSADRRYDVGVKYGLLEAQLALALSGNDRDVVLSKLVELLAQ